MKTIHLTETTIAAAMGRNQLSNYMLDVAENGHRVGVLSGANLKGRARHWGAWYAWTRARVAAAVEKATEGRVTPGSVLVNSRWARVWIDAQTGEPVELIVES